MGDTSQVQGAGCDEIHTLVIDDLVAGPDEAVGEGVAGAGISAKRVMKLGHCGRPRMG